MKKILLFIVFFVSIMSGFSQNSKSIAIWSWKLIDKTGNVIIQDRSTKIPDKLSSDRLQIRTFYPNITYVVDENGKRIFTLNDYSLVTSIFGDLYVLRSPNGVGAVNSKNKIVIPFEYDYLEPFVDGCAKAKKGELMGIINTRNEVVMPFEYHDITPFTGSLFIVEEKPVAEKEPYPVPRSF